MEEGYYACPVCGTSELELCESGVPHTFVKYKHPGPVGSLDPIDAFLSSVM